MVQPELEAFADRHGANELILESQISDHSKRVLSIQIAVGIMAGEAAEVEAG